MKTLTTLTITLAALGLLATASAVEVLPPGYTVKPFASYTCSVSQASIGLPYGMVCAPDGNLYLSQWHDYPDSGSLYRISPFGQVIQWRTGFGTPRRIVWAGGSGFGDFLYVTDGTSETVFRVSLSGEVTNFAEVSGGLHSLGLAPAGPYGGRFYVATRGTDEMWSVTPDGQVLYFSGFPGGVASGHADLAFDPGTRYGGLMYAALDRPVGMEGVGGVFSIDTNGEPTRFAPELVSAFSVGFAPATFGGDLFVCGRTNAEPYALWRVDRAGQVTRFATHTMGTELRVFTFTPDGALLLPEFSWDEQRITISKVVPAEPPVPPRFVGSVIAWGRNVEGQTNVPPGLSDVVAIAAGGDHCLALKSDGTVVAWGSNTEQQSRVPPGLSDVMAVSAGAYHSVALRSNGTVVAWGQNLFGEISVPPGLSNVVAIDCGYYHTLALKADGTAVGWGRNWEGQCDPPAGAANLAAISAGGYHSLGLTRYGTVIAWGTEPDHYIEPPAGLNNVTQIACGYDHALALKQDRTVVAWAFSAFGTSYNQATIPHGVTNILTIAAGTTHNLAVRADGIVLGWGSMGPAPAGLTNAVAFSGGNAHGMALVADQAPGVLLHPENRIAFVGTTTELAVRVVGGAPLSYQWQFQGTDIPEATTDRLVFSAVQLRDAGEYRLIASNPFGAVTSLTARLTVLAQAPFIVQQPADQSVLPMRTAAFDVVADGARPLGYQWYREEAALAGATNASLTISNAQSANAGAYQVVVANAFGSVTSQIATLIIRPVPSGPGSLDLSFDPTASEKLPGITGAFPTPWLRALALEPDGRVYAGGDFSAINGEPRAGLARLQFDGTLDRSFQPFWTNGVEVFALTRQPDGKLLAVWRGSIHNYPTLLPDGGVVRLNPDGSRDPTFTNFWSGFKCLALQADGKVLLGGEFMEPRTGIARFNSDGTLDETFTPPLLPAYDGTTVNAITVQPDGKILVGGSYGIGLLRLNPDGSEDAGFHSGLDIGGEVNAIQLQPDGRILVGGSIDCTCGDELNNVMRLHADGSVDPSFHAVLDIVPLTLALQTDGRILAAGECFGQEHDSEIVRFNSDGSRDASFQASVDIRYGWPMVSTMAVQPNGDILIGGAFTNVNGLPAVAIARLQNRGVGPEIVAQPANQTSIAGQSATFAVDVTGTSPFSYQWLFGGEAITGATNATLMLQNVQPRDAGRYSVIVTNAYGSVTSRVATLTVVPLPAGSEEFAYDLGTSPYFAVHAVVVQPDGAALVGGSFNYINNAYCGPIGRVHPDGRVDVLHQAPLPPNNTVHAIALQNDGKIIFAGAFTAASVWPNRICRLHADGSGIDATFNVGWGPNDTVYALALQADGKVLLGGAFTTVNGVARNRIARLNTDGSLDATFNPGAGPNAGSDVHALAVQSDGKVLLGGTFTNFSGVSRSALARLNADGSLDASFNPGGGGAIFDWVACLALQPNGKVLAGGRFPPVYLGNEGRYSYRGGLARLELNGSIDPTFNPGVQVTWPERGDTVVRAIALQPDGKILIGGVFIEVNREYLHSNLARLHENGSVDTTFVPAQRWDYHETVFALAAQRDGKVLVGGRLLGYDLIRLTGDDGPPVVGTHPVSAESSVGFPARLSVTVANGQPPVSYQWYRDGNAILTGTNATLTLPAVQFNDAGTYHVVVSNVFGRASSAAAELRVMSGPRLVSVGSADGYALGLCFNVPVTPASARNLLNYALTSGGPITNITLRPDGRTVVLRVQTPPCTPFALTASGIVDTGPGYTGGGTAIGRVEGLVAADLGAPAFAGSTFVGQANAFEIIAGGRDFWESADQGHFVYAAHTGDFDVKVRVTSLGASDPSTKAGLMARATLAADSPTLHLDVMPTPPMRNTTEATMRTTWGGSTVGWGWAGTPYNAGLLPADWPNAWLRFARTGNVFRGYTSRDALNWTQFAETSQTFPSALYMGLASTAHNNATQTTAVLRDYGPYEGALAEGLDTSGLVWISPGEPSWFAQTAITHDGSDAAQSGAIDHAVSSTLQTTVTGPGTLTFWWKASSEPVHDRLKFELAGTEQCSIAGEVDWEQRTVEIPPGPQTVAWTYLKNDSVAEGQDAAWLDQVAFTPAPSPPVIVTEPANQGVRLAAAATFSVVAASAAPLSFRWVFNEINTVGLSQPTLTLTNVGSNQLGSYCVVVSNAFGVVSSRVANLALVWPPTITQHPQSLTAFAGSDATFTAIVTNNASLPITYQWRKGSTVLTNIVLWERTCPFTLFHVRTNVTATNGPGNYRVVVRNAANTNGVASTYAALAVQMPPAPGIGRCTFSNGCLHLVFNGPAGAHYTVLASTNLVHWTAVGLATETVAGRFEFTQPAAREQPACFYRLRSP